jgi:hypothetical protein
VSGIMRAAGAVVILAVGVSAQSGVPDLLFSGSRMMGDLRAGGMANAGSALESGALSVFANPALVHAYCRTNEYKGLVSGLSYGRTRPLYDKSLVTFGAGYHNETKGTVVNTYRYLEGNHETQTDYQAVVTYAGQLFRRNEDHGAVDFGINARYEQANWRTTGFTSFDTLVRPAGAQSTWDTLPGRDAVDDGRLLEKRLMFDLGFYQSSVANNLDFSLVLHNLVGYIWRDISPTVEYRAQIDEDTATADTIAYAYNTDPYTTEGWMESWYRRLTVGIVLRSIVVPGKLTIRIPMDLEFAGLFDRDRPTHVMFRCGMEAELFKYVVLRGGYGRQPWYVQMGKGPENENVYGGGLGFHFRGLSIDGFLTNQEWGAGLSFNY